MAVAAPAWWSDASQDREINTLQQSRWLGGSCHTLAGHEVKYRVEAALPCASKPLGGRAVEPQASASVQRKRIRHQDLRDASLEVCDHC